MSRQSHRTGAARSRSMIRRVVAEALESRRLMTVSLTNGLATSSPDYFQVTVAPGGNTRDTLFATTDTIYDYFGFLDTGAAAYNLGTSASEPVIGADGVARSSGTISPAEGGSIAYTVESSIRSGSKAYVNQVTFTATGYDLKQAKYFQYTDADIQSVSDDIVTIKGTVGGTGTDALVLTTIDPATNVRQAQSNGPAGANSALTGFGADRFSSLRTAIAAGTYDAAATGTNNLTATTVTGIGAAFGPADITTALEYGFTSSTTATLSTVLGIDTQLAVAPEIDVQGAGVSILTGDTDPIALDNTEFGSATPSVPTTHSFAVRNIGSTALSLTGTPVVNITGTNAADFTVTQQPGTSVAAGGSSPFQIRFKPTGLGTRTATVTIANSDANEGTYTFTIQGTGLEDTAVPLTVNAGTDYTVNEGAPLTLAGTATGGTGLVTYSWDLNGDFSFDDAFGLTPTVSAAKLKSLGLGDNGTFTAMFRAADDITSTSDSAALTIVNVAPSVNAGLDKTVNEDTAVTLTGTATDPAGELDPLTYGWAVVSGVGATVATGVGPDITFTPADPGVYTATLTVSDGDGGVTTDSALITVLPVVPTVRTVTRFVLVNADTDQDIRVINPGDVINLADLPTRHLNIRADTNPMKVGSVLFTLDHTKTRIENTVPYALFSDDVGNYFSGKFKVGTHSLRATPYLKSRARGAAGSSLSLSFSVVDVEVGRPKVSGFVLLNADTDRAIGALSNGSVISLSQLGTRNLNIRALTTPDEVGSVRFKLDNHTSIIEDYNPYTLFANDLGNFFAGVLSLGTHTLKATPFSAKHAKGSYGPSLSVTFTVVA